VDVRHRGNLLLVTGASLYNSGSKLASVILRQTTDDIPVAVVQIRSKMLSQTARRPPSHGRKCKSGSTKSL
jgi:hypothetical protein